MRLTLLAVAVAAISGCAAVGPNYTPPTAAQLRLPALTAATQEDLAQAHQQVSRPWWEDLGDARLTALIEIALTNSPTVEAAIGRLVEARANWAQTSAGGYPQVQGTVGGTRQAQAKELSTTSASGLSASWEVDLFGAVLRAQQGAAARIELRQADIADVQLSLAADVADAYTGLRQCQAALALATADLLSKQATADLTSLKSKAGFTAPYLEQRAQASVLDAQGSVTAAQLQCDEYRHLLERLVGNEPKLLDEILGGTRAQVVPPTLSVEVVASNLMSRPDLVMAERALAAASADIGLAEANRLPRLSLLGVFSAGVSDSGRGGVSQSSWSIGPSLSVPLFDAGAKKSAADGARARYDQAWAAYRAKLQAAGQEMADSVSRFASAGRRKDTANAAARQYASSFAAVNARYREGLASLLELEDARRVLLAAQQAEVSVQLELVQAWIAVHRAAGQAAFAKTAVSPEASSHP